MTSQEVRALIDAKIKGQGTNVDAGSVLPAILNGILDLIDSGGGGGTSDAVQYVPQTLNEAQQMQARKNQGLYYKEETEGIVEKTTEVPDDFRAAFFDTLGESIPDEVWNNAVAVSGLVKVSNDTPSRNDFISLVYTEYDEGEVDYSEEVSLVGSDTVEINGDYYNIYYGNGYYCLKPDYAESGDGTDNKFLVVTEDSGVDLTLSSNVIAEMPGISSTTVHLSKGLYVDERYGIESAHIVTTTQVKYNYDGIVTVYNNPIESGFTGAVSYKEEQSLVKSEQMQARKNQGLYYSDIIPEQLIVEWDGNTDGLIWIDEKEG